MHYDQECFSGLCCGLSSNRGLEVLDLRNNQLNHQVRNGINTAKSADTRKQIPTKGFSFLFFFWVGIWLAHLVRPNLMMRLQTHILFTNSINEFTVSQLINQIR